MNAFELRRFAPGYFELLDRPSYDAFWEKFDIAARYEKFEVPGLHIAGWYDWFAKAPRSTSVACERRRGPSVRGAISGW